LEEVLVGELINVVDVALLEVVLVAFAFLGHVLKEELGFALETGRKVWVGVL
jgi:hypothetical protein